jgi:hypothetical protein
MCHTAIQDDSITESSGRGVTSSASKWKLSPTEWSDMLQFKELKIEGG